MNKKGNQRGIRLALLSLEAWDQTWRRNQHLTAALVRQGLVDHVTFVEPPRSSPATDSEPIAGVRVHQPLRRLPMRAGGAREVAFRLGRGALSDVDLLWVNDPVIGVHCQRSLPVLYDVTDDWREARAPRRVVRRIVEAEDQLARSAVTVVCSKVLQERWRERYGVHAHLVANAVDADAHVAATRRHLDGDAPHIGYVGTLHDERLDVDVLLGLASDPRIGTLHLVGPDCFSDETRSRLSREPGLILHGAVPAKDVPDWMVSMDVLVSPHIVSPFTLSLDAIKSYEYLATGRPVVATPTSGFQHLAAHVRLSPAERFVDEVVDAVTDISAPLRRSDWTWDAKADEIAAVIRGVIG